MTAQTKEKRRKKMRVSDGIGILLCVLLLPVVLINMTLILHSLIHPEIPPNFLGYTPLVVESDSMAPLFQQGDLVIVKNDPQPSYGTGDVICFKQEDTYVTHRIVGIESDPTGSPQYVTQGDANHTPDAERVSAQQILGRYQLRIEGLGTFVLFLQTPTGMVVCVLLPLAVLIGLLWLAPRLTLRKSKT